MKTPLEVLTMGRDRVAAGWTKNRLTDGENCCAVGAVVLIDLVGTGQRRDASVQAAIKALCACLPDRWRLAEHDSMGNLFSSMHPFHADWRKVVYFNNAASTEQADVLALFDRAIAAETAKQIATTGGDDGEVEARLFSARPKVGEPA